MISDIVEAMWQGFRSRMKNPLIGSFIFAWLIWNWRIAFVLLSWEPLDTKTVEIDKLIAAGSWSIFWPASAAVVYVIATPWVTYLLHQMTEHPDESRQLKRLESKNKILDEALKVAGKEEKIDRLRFQQSHKLKDLESRYRARIENHNHERSELQDEIRSLKSQLEQKTRSAEELEGLESKIKALESHRDSLKEQLAARNEEVDRLKHSQG